MKKIWKRIFRHYVSALSGAAFTRLISFVTAIEIARALSVEDFGYFSFFFVTMHIIKSVLYVLDINYIKEIDSDLKEEYIGLLVFAKFAVSVVVIAFLLPVVFLYTFYFPLEGFQKMLVYGVLAGVMFGLLNSLATYYREQFKFFRSSLIGSFFTYMVFMAISFYVFVLHSLTLEIVLNVFVLSSFAMSVMVIVVFLGPLRSVAREGGALVKKLRGFLSTMRGMWSAHLITVVGQRIDVVILPFIFAPHEIGLYGAAVRISQIVQFLVDSIV
ncbi:hypothetical protein LCGC14_2099370, partial [marine sediment metagenome]